MKKLNEFIDIHQKISDFVKELNNLVTFMCLYTSFLDLELRLVHFYCNVIPIT